MTNLKVTLKATGNRVIFILYLILHTKLNQSENKIEFLSELFGNLSKMSAMAKQTVNMTEQIVKVIEEELNVDDNVTLESLREKIQAILSKKKEKKSRKKRDKNAPKRAMSAYGFFCIDKRPELAEEYKSNPRELMKALGESWKKAKKGDVSKWEELASKDKERYENEMENYNPPSDEEIEAQYKKKGKKAKDTGKPKRVSSLYIRFCGVMRPRLGELSSKQLTQLYGEDVQSADELKGSQKTKVLGAFWRAVAEAQDKGKGCMILKKKELKDVMKQIEEEYNADKERYEREMNEWKSKNGEEIVPKEAKQKKKVIKKQKAQKGEKKINSYLFFAKRFRPLAKEKVGNEKGAVTKEIARQWRSLDELDNTIKPEIKKRLTDGEDEDSVWEWFSDKMVELQKDFEDDDDEESLSEEESEE